MPIISHLCFSFLLHTLLISLPTHQPLPYTLPQIPQNVQPAHVPVLNFLLQQYCPLLPKPYPVTTHPAPYQSFLALPLLSLLGLQYIPSLLSLPTSPIFSHTFIQRT
ncbi:hypothetical protein K437DRAFT_260187 [Tilletiaria anomala UBC 951]|uniref:Uncharacterized protein n=1 Tax=Tilletiaria anomala (strain ATCC 24038 / CBS 436.72 / UBC 951) TaxID=1037660 RepID=A0A066VCD5_TILAU|nr:uncharacterized protein K437DRAFT_260187 [Tilletiaria anomala UBC 951]KDN36250.1 hypothetical protein K437DRAFT_260187 [Tilletiaria anomala UBC 951]